MANPESPILTVENIGLSGPAEIRSALCVIPVQADGVNILAACGEWSMLRWSDKQLAAMRHRRLIGHMEAPGFSLRAEAVLHALTEDILKSSEIEGEVLDGEQVRFSIARALGLGITPWLLSFIGCLDRAFEGAETILASVMRKARFWETGAGQSLNERRHKVINRLPGLRGSARHRAGLGRRSALLSRAGERDWMSDAVCSPGRQSDSVGLHCP